MTEKRSPKKLEATNKALWMAEDKMGDAHRIIYRISEANSGDPALKELEERLYSVWSDFLAYMNTVPLSAEERANLEWTAGRASRKVLSRFFGDEVSHD